MLRRRKPYRNARNGKMKSDTAMNYFNTWGEENSVFAKDIIVFRKQIYKRGSSSEGP